jgi:hypothetical protein
VAKANEITKELSVNSVNMLLIFSLLMYMLKILWNKDVNTGHITPFEIMTFQPRVVTFIRMFNEITVIDVLMCNVHSRFIYSILN